MVGAYWSMASLTQTGTSQSVKVSPTIALPWPKSWHTLSTELQDWMLRLRNAENIFVYAIVTRDAIPANDLDMLTQWCKKRGWMLSIQGRKLYCVPAVVTKEAAVAEVTRRVGGQHFIAAGDSLLDRGMLTAAWKAFRPSHGELESEGFWLDSLEAVNGSGVLAGEEIVRRIHALVANGVRSQGSRPSCDCGSPVESGRARADNAPFRLNDTILLND